MVKLSLPHIELRQCSISDSVQGSRSLCGTELSFVGWSCAERFKWPSAIKSCSPVGPRRGTQFAFVRCSKMFGFIWLRCLNVPNKNFYTFIPYFRRFSENFGVYKFFNVKVDNTVKCCIYPKKQEAQTDEKLHKRCALHRTTKL